MPTPLTLPPNPSLLALILTIRTRSGPRFVFHYPAVPEPSQSASTWHFGSAGSDSESSGDDQSSDTDAEGDDDDSTSASGAPSASGIPSVDGKSVKTSKTALTGISSSTRRTARTLREDGPEDEDQDEDIEPLDLSEGAVTDRTRGDGKVGAGDEEEVEARRASEADWERLLGYPTEGLEKMLSPPRSMRKKRFEVLIEDVVFLGYPVFCREDGFWKKRKKEKTVAETHYAAYDDVYGESDLYDEEEENAIHNVLAEKTILQPTSIESPPISPTDTRTKINGTAGRNINQTLAPDPNLASQSYRSQGAVSEAASEAKSVSTASGSANGNEMSMFHVVFVMDPPALEYHVRVQEMYEHVAKKFAKALKFEQARSNYVWKEAQKIQAMKAQGKENSECIVLFFLYAQELTRDQKHRCLSYGTESSTSRSLPNLSRMCILALRRLRSPMSASHLASTLRCRFLRPSAHLMYRLLPNLSSQVFGSRLLPCLRTTTLGGRS